MNQKFIGLVNHWAQENGHGDKTFDEKLDKFNMARNSGKINMSSNENVIKHLTEIENTNKIDLRLFGKLPHHENAEIEKRKIKGYSLKEENKALVFKSALGYDETNADELEKNIKDNLKNFEAQEQADIGYGKRYQVDMVLTGPNKKNAKVRTAWLDDKKTGKIRLVSAYVIKEKKNDNK